MIKVTWFAVLRAGTSRARAGARRGGRLGALAVRARPARGQRLRAAAARARRTGAILKCAPHGALADWPDY